MSLENMFMARSVAVIGASTTPGKTGHTILKNIIDGGYTGEVFPVNPRATEILGKKAYRDLTSIGHPVDLMVVVVPAPAVPGIMAEARQAGIKAAVIITGGFGEIGNTQMEKNIVEEARAGGIRIVGPNSQGFNYTHNNLCATWPLVTRKGPIAIVSQSGTVGAAISGWAEEEGLGISGFVGLGNKSDVSELELMEFFGQDPATKVIALYIERVKDGPAFLKIAGEIAERKPIVVLKGGRTPQGRVAAQSHTRSVAGRYEVFQAACRKIGIIPAKDVTELYDYAKAAAFLPKPPGRRFAVVTSSGGSGILATDAAVDAGFEIASLSSEVKEILKAKLPPQCVVSNPLDLTGDATSDRYLAAVETIASHAAADVYALVFGDPIPGALEAVQAMRREAPGPVGVVYIGGGQVGKDEAFRMQAQGIPVFPTPERAVKSLAALLQARKTFASVV